MRVKDLQNTEYNDFCPSFQLIHRKEVIFLVMNLIVLESYVPTKNATMCSSR